MKIRRWLFGLLALVLVAGGILFISGKLPADFWRPFASSFGAPWGDFQVKYTVKERLDIFIGAIAKGNNDGALAGWHIPSELSAEVATPLAERRDKLIALLSGSDVSPNYSILDVQLWGPRCCENSYPSVPTSYISAIGARVTIQLVDKQGNPLDIYYVDIFAPPSRQNDWGAVKYWQIVDVYSPSEKPLYWPYVFTPEVKPVP
jgi:hypothetical protein